MKFWFLLSILMNEIISCVSFSNLIWSSTKSSILLNNEIVHIKGITWNGFETENMVFLGLYMHSMEFYLDKLREQNFNAIRVPFSLQWIYYLNSSKPFYGSVYKDNDCFNLTSLQILDLFFEKTLRKNLLVVLCLDRLYKDYLTNIWYSVYDFPIDHFYQSWFSLLDRYKNYPNLFAIDVYNEPHSQKIISQWYPFLFNFTNEIILRFPNYSWLFFIQGINWSTQFLNNASFIFNSSRFIYTPHMDDIIQFNYNHISLYERWFENFGFLQEIYQKNVLITQCIYPSEKWLFFFINYLLTHNMTNIFLWQINTNPYHGIFLEDWTSLRSDRLTFIQNIQNQITFFDFNNEKLLS